MAASLIYWNTLESGNITDSLIQAEREKQLDNNENFLTNCGGSRWPFYSIKVILPIMHCVIILILILLCWIWVHCQYPAEHPQTAWCRQWNNPLFYWCRPTLAPGESLIEQMASFIFFTHSTSYYCITYTWQITVAFLLTVHSKEPWIALLERVQLCYRLSCVIEIFNNVWKSEWKCYRV